MRHFKVAQPALLYLAPAVILGLFVACYREGSIKQMWNYVESSAGGEDDDEKTDEEKTKELQDTKTVETKTKEEKSPHGEKY